MNVISVNSHKYIVCKKLPPEVPSLLSQLHCCSPLFIRTLSAISEFFFLPKKKLEHVRWRCLTKYAAFSIPTNISSGASLESSSPKSSSYWVTFSSPSSFVSASVSSSGSSSELSLSNCVGKTNGLILSLASSPVSLMTPFGYEFIYINNVIFISR